MGLGVLIFLVTAGPHTLFAREEIPYDPYSFVLKHPEAVTPHAARRRSEGQWITRLGEQPLRPAGHGLGKTVEWIERKHVDEKVVWFFDELSLRGIYPTLRTPTEGSFGTFGLGGRIDLNRLVQAENQNISFETFGGWAPSVNFGGTTFDFGGSYQLKLPIMLGAYHEGLFRYARSSSESFYGLGNATSRGDWSTYSPRELWLEGSFTIPVTYSIEGKASVIYQNMNMGNGNRKAVGKIKERFASGVPGINGGNLFGLKAAFEYDTRDHEHDPKKGGYGSLDVSYVHDVDGSDFHYVKARGSIAQFFRLKSDRRVLAIRLSAEQNEELGGDDVPFFNQARLGGAKLEDGSELLRSYRYNRFFDRGLALANMEYRYSVYEYGDFQADAVGLFDVGEVFSDFGAFSFGELDLSYGGGINVKFRRQTIFSITVAHGSEGTSVYSHSTVSF